MDDNGIAGVSSSNAIAAPSNEEVVVEKDIPVGTSSSRSSDEEDDTTTTEASLLESKLNDLHLSPPEQHRRRRCPNQALLLCDAWFGFPTEKRPRRERVNAVSRQLANFVTFQQEQSQDQTQTDGAACHVEVRLVGTSDTTDLIRDRMTQLNNDNNPITQECSSLNSSQSSLLELFYPDTSLSQCFHDWQQTQTVTPSSTTTTTTTTSSSSNHDAKNSNTSHEDEDWICYLSPDAPEALDPNEPPPMAVVVGMLVDRRIAPNRSLHRCQTLLETTATDDSTDTTTTTTTKKRTILARRLPLHVVQNDIPTHEPLNIDTVMELMHRWWSNYHHYYYESKINNDDTIQTS
eukprot:scaffold330412_cov51-Attheya_sp.AAC.1